MTAADKLVVAISSRALFDLDESHRVFEQEGEKTEQQAGAHSLQADWMEICPLY